MLKTPLGIIGRGGGKSPAWANFIPKEINKRPRILRPAIFQRGKAATEFNHG
jgi:hypothetical protein